ncbi:MAG: hypothetical protein R3F49_14125 [Planctomycetota bacterium]
MKTADRRRLDQLFDGTLGIEDELALERDAARDPELGAALARARALAGAFEALPQPLHEQLDVGRLAARVRGALDARDARDAARARGVERPRRSLRRQVGAVCGAAAAVALGVFGLRRAEAPAHVDLEPVSGERSPAAARMAAHGGERGDEWRGDAGRGATALPAGAPVEVAFSEVDTAQREGALRALTEALVEPAVLAGFDPIAGDAAAFADRVERAFEARVAGVWPVASLSSELLLAPDVAVAAGAARHLGARADALTAACLERALRDELAMLATRVAAPTSSVSADPAADVEAAHAALLGERRPARLALARALLDLERADALARCFAGLCAAHDIDPVLAAAAPEEVAGFGQALAALRDWSPSADTALAPLARLGRPGADVLVRLALEGWTQRARRGAGASPDVARGAIDAALLAALCASPYGAEAVAGRVDTFAGAERRPTPSRAARVCALIEATGALGALDWLAGLGRRGDSSALMTLARLPGERPVAALLDLDAAGFAREDAPWRALVSADGGRVAAHLRVLTEARAAQLVSRLITLDEPAAAAALLVAVDSEVLGERARERAALALAELAVRAQGDAGSAALRVDLRALATAAWQRDGDDVVAALVIAAVAWLGEDELGSALLDAGASATTVERVQRAAAPSGSTLTRQERVARTLAIARGVARETGRGNRGTDLR